MNIRHIAILATGLLLTGTARAQTAPTSGTIAYETMRRVDRSNFRVNANGQGNGQPNAQVRDLPDNMTIEGNESYRFAGHWAVREPSDRRNGMNFMMGRNGGGPGNGGQGGPPGGDGPGGGGDNGGQPSEQMRRAMERMRTMRFPVEDVTYTDLSNGKAFTITAVTVDSTHKDYYRSGQPVKRPADWEVSGKTRKMLGYTCQKATCTIKDQPCTVWFTTDLPFTFSPAPNFTPDKGVVLLIESDDLLYRATKISAGAVDEASLQPSASAREVTKEEMDDIRRKAMATFRQQNAGQFQRRN